MNRLLIFATGRASQEDEPAQPPDQARLCRAAGSANKIGIQFQPLFSVHLVAEYGRQRIDQVGSSRGDGPPDCPHIRLGRVENQLGNGARVHVSDGYHRRSSPDASPPISRQSGPSEHPAGTARARPELLRRLVGGCGSTGTASPWACAAELLPVVTHDLAGQSRQREQQKEEKPMNHQESLVRWRGGSFRRGL